MPAVVSSHHQDTMQSPPSPTNLDGSGRHTYTYLTYSRHHLIDTAMGTIKIAENGQYVNYVDRKTPTRGREVSVLEQIFGSVGRLPTDRIGGGQQDVPGGGR